jgi:chemotaxis protein histidine kinase CheA
MPEESFTVRVPSERLDRMLNLAGELGISQQSGEEVSQRLTGLRELLEHYKREPGESFDNPAGLMEALSGAGLCDGAQEEVEQGADAG